jgi:hypothetical protein
METSFVSSLVSRFEAHISGHRSSTTRSSAQEGANCYFALKPATSSRAPGALVGELQVYGVEDPASAFGTWGPGESTWSRGEAQRCIANIIMSDASSLFSTQSPHVLLVLLLQSFLRSPRRGCCSPAPRTSCTSCPRTAWCASRCRPPGEFPRTAATAAGTAPTPGSQRCRTRRTATRTSREQVVQVVQVVVGGPRAAVSRTLRVPPYREITSPPCSFTRARSRQSCLPRQKMPLRPAQRP